MRETKTMTQEILKEMSKYMEGSMEGLIRERGDRFRYPVYMSAALLDKSIEEMELSVRAHHCLQRAGFHTVGDLVSEIDGREDLMKIRSMGKLSANEVMVSLCCFQYSLLNEEKKKSYVKRIMELNTV